MLSVVYLETYNKYHPIRNRMDVCLSYQMIGLIIKNNKLCIVMS